NIYSAAFADVAGPLRPYLEDDSTTELIVNGSNAVYVEKDGRLRRLEDAFEGPEQLEAFARVLAQFVGKRLENNARIDGRTPEGARVHIVHGPTVGGTIVAIRRASHTHRTLDDLVAKDALTAEAAAYLRTLTRLGRNIIFTGPPSCGKTTLLGAVASELDSGLRVLVLEDSRELSLPLDHVVYLEARPSDEHGEGGVTLLDLLHSSLRLRGDALVVGEVRGEEALPLVLALTSGYASTGLSTLHAASPGAALARLETLCLMALPSMAPEALRLLVREAVHVVVQAGRTSMGRRRVTTIAEVTPSASAPMAMFDIAPTGPQQGQMVWTGRRSCFADDLVR
ncbi:unnamed protein product, partial [Sphacelaria rigidula]